ncbi:GNAT family N-acetyltransferase [Arthrobacter sp. NEB 688]|uniref:GNAT family N-acetyltransferase n=1 Tax=Arthrobacter sp. NEB 688 TaxID=904039 RepID=UPI0015667320|nr:GNAT family N-acetyltransferase [Arthrobacter sp. NEB 688]QKE85250.1 GNAT family N-acetyltransferase [Arthrobacter sp. NEB 688]
MPSTHPPPVVLSPVDATTWRAVAALRVAPEQEAFVAAPLHYLALCAYGGVWSALAASVEDEVVGFLMQGVDDEDGSVWLGGILVDARHQGRGVGRAMVTAALDRWAAQAAGAGFALTYDPANTRAAGLYRSLGFVETGEVDDDEVVARRPAAG